MSTEWLSSRTLVRGILAMMFAVIIVLFVGGIVLVLLNNWGFLS